MSISGCILYYIEEVTAILLSVAAEWDEAACSGLDSFGRKTVSPGACLTMSRSNCHYNYVPANLSPFSIRLRMTETSPSVLVSLLTRIHQAVKLEVVALQHLLLEQRPCVSPGLEHSAFCVCCLNARTCKRTAQECRTQTCK